MSNAIINKLRYEYSSKTFDEKEALPNPITQFDVWMNEALKAEVMEPNAFVLSTVDELGKPSSRIVLLRKYDANGFVFFTNYNSRKGISITGNPNVCFNFFHQTLERQIRIEGTVEKLNNFDSDEYFNSRPLGNRLGAWASNQSEKIDSREKLEEKQKQFEQEFSNGNVPRPAHWGGYICKPNYFEFWQGRSSRLHDRLAYELIDGQWRISRLSP
jgi:pyridoxamine 5'-phosphate oxidase